MNRYQRLKLATLTRGCGFSARPLAFSTSSRCANTTPSTTTPSSRDLIAKSEQRHATPRRSNSTFANAPRPTQQRASKANHSKRTKSKPNESSQHTSSAPREWSMLRRRTDKKPLNTAETTTLEQALSKDSRRLRLAFDTTNHDTPTSTSTPAQRSSMRMTDLESAASDDMSMTDISTTLILQGLKPGIQSSDFTRLIPSILDSWNVGIKSVRQMRTRKNFEPLNKWEVQFYSREAVDTFRDKVKRLQSLAVIKAQHGSSPLWQGYIPEKLQSPAGESPDDLIQSFTLAAGSQMNVSITVPTRRQRLVSPWKHVITNLVKDDGYGELPPLILLEVYPSRGLTASRLAKYIVSDTGGRNMSWKVSNLHPLKSLDGRNQHQETETDEQGSESQVDANEVQPSARYIVSAVNEAEARRFERYWNARRLSSLGTEFTVKAQYLPWNF